MSAGTGAVWTIIVAAGSGSRFGSEKQFASLGGRAVFEWSVEAAREVSEGIVLVVPGSSASSLTAKMKERRDARGEGAVESVVSGGSSRSMSVRLGLEEVPEAAEVIVVHDGARPFASPALFKTVVESVLGGAEGAVPVRPVDETLKRVEEDKVIETVDRAGLVSVQTPQAFRADLLRRAHLTGADSTDDSALVEALGATVVVVPGEVGNVKLTTPADMELAKRLAGP